jgi:superfamily II DNA or RNA helicase
VFDNLKQNNTYISTSHHVPKLLFVLYSDKHGVYIEVCDEHFNELPIKHDLDSYTPQEHALLKALELISTSQLFVIDWEKDSSRIYLDQHEHLMQLLSTLDNVVDDLGKPIHFEKEMQHLCITLTQHEQRITPQFSFNSDAIWINQHYILQDNRIIKMHAIGSQYAKLPQFQNTFDVDFLEQYCSLLFSFFENVQLQFEPFTITYGSAITLKDALVIEKVDAQGLLYLKALRYAPKIDISFLNDFALTTLAYLDNQTITLHPLKRQTQNPLQPTLIKRLNRHKKSCNASYFIDRDSFIIEPALATQFLKTELPDLLAHYPLIGSSKLKKYKIKATTPTLKLDKSSWGVGYLKTEVTLDVDNENFALFDAVAMAKKRGYIELSSGDTLIVPTGYFTKLERLIHKEKGETKISFFDLPQIEEMLQDKQKNTLFDSSRALYEGFNTLDTNNTTLPSLKATLRPYQAYGFSWLKYLYDNHIGACLADDMGLGKTLQTIALLSHITPKATKPILVVLPKSLLYNWQKELEKFAPDLAVTLYYGANRDYHTTMQNPLILTSYAMVRNDIALFQETQFDTVILDESQAIKNFSAQITKAILLLQAEHRIALSGTPVENSLSELFVLFKFLNPSMFHSAEAFNQNYLNPIQKEQDPQALDSLKRKIYPFILRRLKTDVAKDLPAKTEQILYVEMSETQAELYERRRTYYENMLAQEKSKQSKKSETSEDSKSKGNDKSSFFILQALSELRQIASNPQGQSDSTVTSTKHDMLMHSINDAISNNHKILVFTNYLNVIDQITSSLTTRNIKHLSMSGETKDRQALVDTFQNDPECKVFVMTLKVGGVGLTLTRADMVFIHDPWWNKTAENQAIDRTHRIGQLNPVTAYKLITKNSIEEKIVQLQAKKSEIFDALLSSDGTNVKALEADDIAFLLGK